MQSPKNESSVHKMKKSNYLLVRILWIVLGCLFVFIGTLGFFVPGLALVVKSCYKLIRSTLINKNNLVRYAQNLHR